jgi:hypothetical protein
MRKALRIIALTTGIISLVSAAILCFMYMEEIAERLKKTKARIDQKRAQLQDPDDFVF